MPQMDDQNREELTGIDLSAFVKEIHFDDRGKPFVTSGLKPVGALSLSRAADDGRETCWNCRQRFTPGPEGTPALTNSATGETLIVCPPCAMAVLG